MPIISPTAISPHRIGGKSLLSYWATLSSATVETAAPTHVVLTFPAAQTSLGATDFTIAGFTISSASWTGAVLTLVLSTSVLVFDEDLTITFAKTGTTATVTNNVADDGHTVAWYDASDTSTLTKATGTTEAVSRWNDKLGSGHDLIQATGNKQPIWSADGVLGDGSNDSMKTEAFTYEQPEKIYMVLKIFDTNIPSKGLMDGNAVGTGLVYHINNSPTIPNVYAGADLGFNEVITDTLFIMRVLFDGAASKTQNNTLAAKTGNSGTADMGGITLFAWGNDTLWGKAQIIEAIFRDSADDAATEAAIYNYLENKFFFLNDVILDESGGSYLITEDGQYYIQQE